MRQPTRVSMSTPRLFRAKPMNLSRIIPRRSGSLWGAMLTRPSRLTSYRSRASAAGHSGCRNTRSEMKLLDGPGPGDAAGADCGEIEAADAVNTQPPSCSSPAASPASHGSRTDSKEIRPCFLRSTPEILTKRLDLHSASEVSHRCTDPNGRPGELSALPIGTLDLTVWAIGLQDRNSWIAPRGS